MSYERQIWTTVLESQRSQCCAPNNSRCSCWIKTLIIRNMTTLKFWSVSWRKINFEDTTYNYLIFSIHDHAWCMKRCIITLVELYMLRSQTSTLSIRYAFILFLGLLFIVLVGSECAWYWEQYSCSWPRDTMITIAQDIKELGALSTS